MVKRGLAVFMGSAQESRRWAEAADLTERPAGCPEAEPDLAARFGYRPRAVESLDLARPQDIFDHVP
jgi:hypothetical protein